MNARYPHLASSFQLAPGLTLANRLVMAPVACNMATGEGMVTDEALAFYEERAKRGVGAIIVGGTAVAEDGGVTRRTMRLHSRAQQKGIAELAQVVKRCCPVGLQLFHAGGQGNPAYTGFPLRAPSPYCHPPIGFWAKAMDAGEIAQMVSAFVHAAMLALEAGMDFVELHAAHGYLLHEFLSPYFNHRRDAYGGSNEGRSRLLFTILDGIRAADGQALRRVGLRLSAYDFVPNGLSMEFYRWLLPRLEPYELLYYHITAGVYDSAPEKRSVMASGGFQRFAAQFKNLTSRPIVTVGHIRSLAAAEACLAAGQADVVAVARSLIADPAFVAKGFAGEEQAIKQCVGCNQCHYLAHNRPEAPVRCWS